MRSLRPFHLLGLLRPWLAAFGAALSMLLFASSALAQDTMVRINTTQGLIDIRLYDSAAPKTVTNFLAYVRKGSYNGTFFHRSEPGFVIQGGGWSWPNANAAVVKTAVDPAVQNEFSTARPNVRGTVAMAKPGGNPNGATVEWFFNLADNTTILGATNNGGFTVFGKVTASGMAVVDAMAKLRIVNAGSPFNTLPVTTTNTNLTPADLVRVLSVTELRTGPQLSDSDRLFNYLEGAYPQFLSPAGAVSTTGSGYYYRYYAATNSYIGTQGGEVFYLVPAINDNINSLGPLPEWLATAAAQGY